VVGLGVTVLALCGLRALRENHAEAGRPTAVPVISADCDSHYSGQCVPICSDVDCEGGSGNGPCYVPGPFRHPDSTDPYDLDRDGDGIACERRRGWATP